MVREINSELSVILPVVNERENLEYLIPQLVDLCIKHTNQFEVLVVDDDSSDNTDELIEKLQKKYTNLRYIKRLVNKSLPMSILEGIEKSKFENVLWLDADGSMEISAVESLLHKFFKHQFKFFIGSRFVVGGGYKGQTSEKINIFKIFKNIRNSEDSFIAIYLSILFNKLLESILHSGVKDLTSGFMIGNKKHINKSVFTESNYGEYFVYLVSDLVMRGQEIIEVGYICRPRVYGSSKTSTNFMTLIRLGLPYIKAAIICKRRITQKR